MTTEARKRLGRVVGGVLRTYREQSPAGIERSYAPERSPVSARTIQRIIAADADYPKLDDEDLKLPRLTGMLRLPRGTLGLVYAGDAAAVERLDFPEGDEDVRQFILDLMQPPARKATRRAR